MSANGLGENKIVPKQFGPLKGANGNARILGPCGDTMEFWVFIQDERVQKCTFTTDGCTDSIACGASACRLAAGTLETVAYSLSPADVLALIPGLTEESSHCALLAINTLKAAIEDKRVK